MKIPKKVKIGGRIFRVQYPHIFTDSTNVLFGQCDMSGQIIRVSNINTHGETRHCEGVEQTFVHEILHAIDFIYVCGKIGKLENSEDIIDQLAEGILQVFKDNKLNFSDRTKP